MKRKLGIFVFLILMSGAVFSQFDAQLSQYMFNNTAYNPAAVGESGMIELAGQHRLNWIGIPNAGATTTFNINSPLKMENSLHGLGLSVQMEEFGFFTNQTFHLQYAYKKRFGEGVFSIGAQAGFVSLTFAGDSVVKHPITIGEYHNFSSDTEIPTGSVVGNSFDAGVGVWYTAKDWYAGLSYLHLNNPSLEWGTNSQFKLGGLMNLSAGMTYKFQDPKYEFKPSMFVKSDFRSFQIDAVSRIEYDQKFWGGLGYRLQDAVILMAGMNIAGGLSIGYSFDVPANRLITGSWGSHEIALVYSFEYVFTKSKTKYKSIRIL
ncbi:MAG: PorP/SprF family type IX secretion system membrane protein [Paludibacteraceae bacterium]|nr:PorP/SprF family type IX secretion system membrane protein [Paludibacteraceae bacterium]